MAQITNIWFNNPHIFEVTDQSEVRSGDALGESEVFVAFQEQLSRAAKVNRPVLIIGERGSGKELAVKRLHYLSARWQAPLVALNCAALAPGVLESELFGHESGAFTGAQRQRRGRFEMADGGTLFLDEIGLMPITVQEKVLRVVEYGGFERVGGQQTVSVDVRIVGATNADLRREVRQNRFKPDLLDRLSFEVLFIPPLRERKDDILLLARHFAQRMARELGSPEVISFSDKAEKSLLGYHWPGNIRELKNVIERAVYRAEDPEIHRIYFDPFECPWHIGEPVETEDSKPTADLNSLELIPGKSLPEKVRQLEAEALQSALQNTNHHQGRAADYLGLSYHQFRSLLRRHRKDRKKHVP